VLFIFLPHPCLHLWWLISDRPFPGSSSEADNGEKEEHGQNPAGAIHHQHSITEGSEDLGHGGKQNLDVDAEKNTLKQEETGKLNPKAESKGNMSGEVEGIGVGEDTACTRESGIEHQPTAGNAGLVPKQLKVEKKKQQKMAAKKHKSKSTDGVQNESSQ